MGRLGVGHFLPMHSHSIRKQYILELRLLYLKKKSFHIKKQTRKISSKANRSEHLALKKKKKLDIGSGFQGLFRTMTSLVIDRARSSLSLSLTLFLSTSLSSSFLYLDACCCVKHELNVFVRSVCSINCTALFE